MLLRAPLLDAPTRGELRYIEDGLLVIDETGRIEAAGRAADLLSDILVESHEVFDLPDGIRPVCVPGLIDLHTHLPQYPVVARREEALLPWLERHIFPTELEFQGPGQRALIEAFFDALARNGTSTAVLYSAIWEDSTDLAFEIAQERGLRAVIGKMMMDVGSYGQSHPPEARRKSLDETIRLAAKWHGANQGLLEFAVSPRFALTCSMDLMQEAARVAEEFGCYIQSHLAENAAEVAKVAEKFPEAGDYTDVYARAGLLTERSIFGHAIHLSEREISTLGEAGATVAHCPTSNFFLNSGLCPLDRLGAAGVRIGLGSDVAGGPELNMWQVMRTAVESQQARAYANPDIPLLPPAEAFHLATAGGAAALGKEARIGSLETGKEADLLVLDLNKVLPLDGRFTGELGAQEILNALVYRGGPAATHATFVRGRRL